MLHGHRLPGAKCGTLVVRLVEHQDRLEATQPGRKGPVNEEGGEDNFGASESTTKLEDILLAKKHPTRYNSGILWKFIFQIIFSVAPFECFICKYKFISLGRAVIHVEELHPDWEIDTGIYDLGSCETGI